MFQQLVRSTTAGVFALLLTAGSAVAQVLVSPPLLFMSNEEQFGTFLVENRSQTAQEVTIDFRFGYPASDTLGNLFMQYDDSVSAAKFSLASWIRAFPRQVVLRPGQQQIIRLTVRPPADLEPGMYWTRLVTASVPEAPPVDSVAQGVTAQIIFRLEQVTTAFYRHGNATGGVEVGTLAVRSDSAGPHVVVPLKRTGSAPFLGTLGVKLLDASGAVVQEVREPTAVYFDLLKHVALPVGDLRTGSYTAEVSLTAERSDIPAGVLPPMTPVTSRIRFTVP